MKILIIQLARFGDVLCTWPVINALKRQYPQAQISLLVRERFAAAAPQEGVEVLTFATQSYLRDLLEASEVQPALERLMAFSGGLRDRTFTHVFNLTFSPISSYITHLIATDQTMVRGYTRHSDGHLDLPDDVSAYFYAQVGIGRANRVHVIDLFSGICGVEILDSDWGQRVAQKGSSSRKIMVHLGASQLEKRVPEATWAAVLERFDKMDLGEITVIGSNEESDLASRVCMGLKKVRNLVGKTSWTELRQEMSDCEVFVGADSGPMHLASMVGTPVVNISFDSVNLWETGPKTPGSRILLYKNRDSVNVEHVVEEAAGLLTHRPPKFSSVYVDSDRNYISLFENQLPIEWRTIEGLYFGKRFPLFGGHHHEALSRLKEVLQLSLEQAYQIQIRPGDSVASKILKRTDEIVEVISNYSSVANIFVRRFNAERIRIEPGSVRLVLDHTINVYSNFLTVLDQALSGSMDVAGEVNLGNP